MHKLIKYQNGAKTPSDKKPTEVFFKPEYPYTEPSAFMYSYYHSPNHRKNVEKELYTSANETCRQVYDDYPSYLTSDVGNFIKKQLQQLKTVKREVGKNPEDNSYSQHTHMVTFVKPGAISHELAHATQPDNFNINNQFLKLLKLYKADGQFNSTAKNMIFNEIFDKNKSKNTNALFIESYLNDIYDLDPETHDLHPNEVRADIYQLRQDLYRSGIFDARTQKFNKEHLKRAKGLYDKDATLNRLFKAYSDEDLIDLMNSVVENTNTGKQNDVLYAQNGTTLTGPTIRGKQYPKGTIVTNDPNDPRLQAYQDSLLIHNAGEEAYRDFMQSRTSLGLSNTSWSRIKNKYNSPNVSSAVNRLEKLNNEELSFDKQTPYAPIWKGSTEVETGRVGVLNKPTQPVTYQPFVNRMTPKGLPTPTQSTLKLLRMPDRIELDPTKHAAYRGIDVSHYTDALGRYTAKLNLVTKPGVTGRISYKRGGILKAQEGITFTSTPAFQQSNVKQELIPQQFVQKTKLDTRPFVESTATVFREPRKFKNIVEKQQYWNSLVNKYGSGVKNREGYIDFYDYKLPGIKYEGPINSLYNISPSLIKYLNPNLAKLATNYYLMNETLTSPDKLNRYVLNRAKQRGITLTTQNQIDAATEAARTELNDAMYKSNQQFNIEPSNQYNVNSRPTTWRNLLENRNDISDKALLFASVMDEGGDRFTDNYKERYHPDTVNELSGFSFFGLDTFGQRIDEFINKGYVPKELKDKITFIEWNNEKNEPVTSAYFYSYDDVITAKEAFIKEGRDVVNKEAAKLNINLSKEALDYFTIIAYNYGEAGAKKMMKEYKDAGILDNNKFMQDNSYPSYRQIHNNAKRRLQAKNMLIGEGIIKQDR